MRIMKAVIMAGGFGSRLRPLTDKLPKRGMSVTEMSHRSKPFDAIHNECIALLRELMGISDDYEVLFVQGGAVSGSLVKRVPNIVLFWQMYR